MPVWPAIALVVLTTTTQAFAGDKPMPALEAVPTQGKAPLAVSFTGGSGGATFFGGIQIEFGDGERSAFCRPGRSCNNASADHVYVRPGTYTARLVGQGEGGQRVLTQLTITVE